MRALAAFVAAVIPSLRSEAKRSAEDRVKSGAAFDRMRTPWMHNPERHSVRGGAKGGAWGRFGQPGRRGRRQLQRLARYNG